MFSSNTEELSGENEWEEKLIRNRSVKIKYHKNKIIFILYILPMLKKKKMVKIQNEPFKIKLFPIERIMFLCLERKLK